MSQFVSPINIYHGRDSINHIQNIVNNLGVNKVFLLTDPVLEEIGIINPIITLLEELKIEIYVSTKVIPEPTLEFGNKVVEEIRDYNAELVIGVGGGSAIDLAKVASVLAKNEGNVENYLNLSGDKILKNKGLPKILVPTTAGTGAEVTDIAVFSLSDTKDVITHPFLLADFAVVDPMLTKTLPPRVTAASGIDAFTHALEAFTSVNATPITDLLAIDAMKRISKNIRTAVWNGNDIKSREEMSLGSLLAGMSFYNAGVAGVHALAYPLGGLFKIPHGESNAALLPYVYDEIWPSCMNKLEIVAEIFKLETGGMNPRDIAINVVRYLVDMVNDVGLPTSLDAYGIKHSDIEKLTVNALKQTRLLARSPKKLEEEVIRRIYTNAYNGDIVNV